MQSHKCMTPGTTLCLSLAGVLDPNWSRLGLSSLALDNNEYEGTLPEIWGTTMKWAGLHSLSLANNLLTGMGFLECFHGTVSNSLTCLCCCNTVLVLQYLSG